MITRTASEGKFSPAHTIVGFFFFLISNRQRAMLVSIPQKVSYLEKVKLFKFKNKPEEEENQTKRIDQR